MFDFSHLRTFIAVAEELNFRKAADRLNMTQPPLSRQIALLEHAVGTKLLNRTSRSVSLTPAGHSFLRDAVDLLTRAETAALNAKQASRGEAGSVILGFVPSASIGILPQVISRFIKTHSKIDLSLREMMTSELVESLNAGSIDLGIFRLPQNKPTFPYRKVWSEPFSIAMPKHHPLSNKPNLTLNDLSEQPFIQFSTERGGALAQVLDGYLGSRGIRINAIFSVSQSHTILGLVNQGVGLAIVPRSSGELCMENVVMRPCPIEKGFTSDLYLAHGPRLPNPTAQIVEDFIIQDLKVMSQQYKP